MKCRSEEGGRRASDMYGQEEEGGGKGGGRKNIKRITAIQARMMWLLSLQKEMLSRQKSKCIGKLL